MGLFLRFLGSSRLPKHHRSNPITRLPNTMGFHSWHCPAGRVLVGRVVRNIIFQELHQFSHGFPALLCATCGKGLNSTFMDVVGEVSTVIPLVGLAYYSEAITVNYDPMVGYSLRRT